MGIISQGLITANSDHIQHLLNMEYECVIVDEAHRARRRNLGPGKEDEKPNPNNLMKFLLEISRRTKSMLLATATPVQLYPIEPGICSIFFPRPMTAYLAALLACGEGILAGRLI